MTVPVTPPDPDTPARDPLFLRTYGEPRYRTDSGVLALAYAPDDSLWSVEETGVLRSWGPDGRPAARFFLSDLEPLWAFSPEARWLASASDELVLWDVLDGELIARWDAPAWVTAVAFSPDFRALATGHDDGQIVVWDLTTNRPVAQFRPGGSAVSALAYRPDGGHLAAAFEDRLVRLYDADTGKKLATLPGHEDRVAALCWLPAGRFLVSAGWDGTARLWTPPDPEPAMILNAHAGQLAALAAAPDGKTLAVADSYQSVHLWADPEQGVLGTVLRGADDEVRCLAFSPGGRRLACGSADRAVRVWDARECRWLSGHGTAKARPALALAGGRLVTNCGGAELAAWAEDDGAPAALTAGNADALAASPDGKLLAVGGTDRLVRLLDAATGGVVAILEGQDGEVAALAFSPDGSLLASASRTDGTVWVWDVAGREPVLQIVEAADGCSVESVAWHPDGRRLACGGIDWMATGGSDGAVCVWDVADHEKRASLDGGATHAAWFPDGKRLACATLADGVGVWDAELGERVLRLTGTADGWSALAVTADGGRVMAAGSDRTLRVWDAATGRKLALREFDTAVRALLATPAGGLYAGFDNGTVARLDFDQLVGP